MTEYSKIRNPIDEKALAAYLGNVPSSATIGSDLPSFSEPFIFKQFTFGQSNPTYLIVDGFDAKYVLRRKPSSNSKLVSRSAHAIEREFYMLRGIAHCNSTVEKRKRVPIPRVYFLCEDESIIGSVFYLMEYVQGRSIRDPEMRGIPATEQHLYWESILTTISAIHSVDCFELLKQLPAKHFPQFQPEQLEKARNKEVSYFERQLKTLSAVEKSQAKTVDSIPAFAKLERWVLEHAPKDPSQLTLIHGDCKIDNFLFANEEARVVAVLDWELCTLGHPIFDLANFLQPYIFPIALNQLISPGARIGIENPKSADHVQVVLRLYEIVLGQEWRDNDPKNNPRDLWRLGSVFGLLRLCVISQGVAMRVVKGTASSASAKVVAELYKSLSELALSLIEENSKL